MSWRHGFAAGELGLGNPTRKAVLNALAHHANEYTGRCWPSIERLCLFTGLGRRAVQYALRDLEEAELILTHKRDGKVPIYELTIPGYPPLDQGGAPHAPGGAPHAPGGAASAPEPLLNGKGKDARVPLEEDWQPKDETVATIKSDMVISDQEIERERKIFVLKAMETGETYKNPEAAFRRWCARLPGLNHKPKAPEAPPPPPPAPVDDSPEGIARRFEADAKVCEIKRDPDNASDRWLRAAVAWDSMPGRDDDARRCAARASDVARPDSWHQERANAWADARWSKGWRP